MKKTSSGIGTALVVASGFFWGTMGLFVRAQTKYGFDSIQIAVIRLTVAAVVFGLYLLLTNPKAFRIRLKDLPLLLASGVGSVALMACTYFAAINTLNNVSMAVILLYMSPIWVMLMSAIFFREKITSRKLTALVCAFGGCVLVSLGGGGGFNLPGVALGVLSGIAYAAYSILGVIGLKRMSPFTFTFYSFLFAAVAVLLIGRPGEMIALASQAPNAGTLILLCLGTGVITAVIPFLIYTLGLNLVEPSRAAILATSEPMVATVLGIVVLHEEMRLTSAIGIVAILAAIVILNTGKKKITE